jgi:hypothetical protein
VEGFDVASAPRYPVLIERRIEHMKGKVVLALTLAILMLLGFCAPASYSAPPQMGTFTMGVLEVTADPGEQFLTGNIMHIRNSVGVSALSELPWGTATTSMETLISVQVNVTTGTGSATGKTLDVYPDGTVEGTDRTELTGPGFWVYAGPELTFNGRTIQTGDVFFGLGNNIMAVKHGVSGELKGLETMETATGVTELNPDLTPTGWAISYATGTYKWLK